MSTTNAPLPQMRSLLQDARSQQAEMVRLLGKFVRAESPSLDKASLDRFGRLVAAEWQKRDARVQFVRQRHRGDHMRSEWWPSTGKPKGQLLMLGHLDTVYDVGTLARMPFRVRGGRAYGPGTFDMKGGLVIALFAVDVLRRAGLAPRKRVVCLWTTDEEIGSESSRALIEREAKRSDAVLVLEPASGLDGRVKTARKGVGDVEIIVTGRAAHAGLNPEAGVNAVHELALQIARIMKFGGARRGITVNVDVVEGGTRSNVIAERARAMVDLRVSHARDAAPLERKFRSLRPILRGAKLEVHGGVSRPPMERTAGVERLFRHGQRVAEAMGVVLGESFVGGGSDGNFTAALGVPTLDGLGAAGEGAHSPGEYVLVEKLPERVALVAGLLATL